MDLYVVTGTTRGLGEALARRIALEAGNELVAIARAPDAEIPGGRRFEADLADRRALDAAFDRIEAHLGGRRFAKAVLINNAGVVAPIGPLDRIDGAALERNLQVNLVAPMLLMARFLKATRERAAVRRVINISSGAGRRPIAGWAVYCAAKAGLDMATRVAVLDEQARSGPVEFASLAPGVIDTPMQGVTRGASAEDFPDVERFRTMKADGTLRPAEDVAADILRAESAGRLKGDGVLDLRSLA